MNPPSGKQKSTLSVIAPLPLEPVASMHRIRLQEASAGEPQDMQRTRALAPTERADAQLEGIRLVAGEVADRVGNSLAVAATTMDLVAGLPDLPSDLEALIAAARERLRQAGEDLHRLQRIHRVETKESSLGVVLDLDRSSDWSTSTIPSACIGGRRSRPA